MAEVAKFAPSGNSDDAGGRYTLAGHNEAECKQEGH